MHLNIEKVQNELIGLKNIKNIQLKSIVNYLSNGNCRLKNNILPSKGGIYVFWWTSGINSFKSMDIRTILFKGPKGSDISVEITDEWIEAISIDDKIPLYIGKTAYSIHKRISLHLQLKAKRILPLGNKAINENRKSTANQMRDRIERIFINQKDSRNFILHNIGLSYCILDGDIESVNRFYLEDKAIGEYLPLFNIDIER